MTRILMLAAAFASAGGVDSGRVEGFFAGQGIAPAAVSLEGIKAIPVASPWTMGPAPSDLRGRLRGQRGLRSDISDKLMSLYAAEGDQGAVSGPATVILIKGLTMTPGGGSDYYAPVVRDLQAKGVDAKVAPTRMTYSHEQNLNIVLDEMRGASGRVILIGHSAGGLYAHEAAAVAAGEPELARKLKAVVAIQTPYCGSPKADSTLRWSPIYRDHIRRATVAERQALCDTIPEMPAGVRSLSIATFLPGEGESMENDRVPLESQLVPGSEAVILTGPNHSNLVRGSYRVSPGRPSSVPGEFMAALVRMLLKGR